MRDDVAWFHTPTFRHNHRTLLKVAKLDKRSFIQTDDDQVAPIVGEVVCTDRSILDVVDGFDNGTVSG